MANRTNTSAPYDSYEYYLDYLDLIPVDEKKLKANKLTQSKLTYSKLEGEIPQDSIVIAFWVSLAAFVLLLFLILLYMSRTGSPQMRNSPQHHRTCPWSRGLNLPFCLQRASQETAEEPGNTAGTNGKLEQECPSASLPMAPIVSLLSPGNRSRMGVPMASADIRNKSGEEGELRDRTSQL